MLRGFEVGVEKGGEVSVWGRVVKWVLRGVVKWVLGGG